MIAVISRSRKLLIYRGASRKDIQPAREKLRECRMDSVRSSHCPVSLRAFAAFVAE